MSSRIALIAAACSVLAAGTTQRLLADEPKAAVVSTGDEAMPPVYRRVCAPCHASGGFGARVLTDRLGPDRSILYKGTAMPGVAIRTIVRKGMGHMPAMSRIEVSDAELDEIIAFLKRKPQ